MAGTHCHYAYPVRKIVQHNVRSTVIRPAFETVDKTTDSDTSLQDIVLQKISVNEYNKLHGKSIRDSDIRGRTNGLVIGIERGETRMLNPESTMIFQRGDIVWIVGERKKIQELSGKSIK